MKKKMKMERSQSRIYIIYIVLIIIIMLGESESGSLIRNFNASTAANNLNSDVPLSTFPTSLAAGLNKTSTAEYRDSCQFPSRWEGSWFQSGTHLPITVSKNRVSLKGACVEADGEKYLVYNENEHCFRCIVFHEKHLNLIQYKETFCVPERSNLPKMCSTISGDASLFTMFRLNASPIECPFKGPLTFSYSRGHGECRNPVSNVDSCLDQSTLLFNYQACPDVPGTESTEEEMTCLGSWKEGSYRYLVSLMQYRHHASLEERFRCFAYERVKKGTTSFSSVLSNVIARSSPLITASSSFNNSKAFSSSSSSSPSVLESVPGQFLIRVSQSGDATCNGLTPNEGSRTMTLKKVIQSHKPCHFPQWLHTHEVWHTLDQRTWLTFNSTVMRLVNGSINRMDGSYNHHPNQLFNNPSSPSSFTTITTSSTCVKVGENPSPDEFTFILQTVSEQCRNGYTCARFLRRDAQIVEMQLGPLIKTPEDACHPSNLNRMQLPFTTLTSSNPLRKHCPLAGEFVINNFAQKGLDLNVEFPSCTNKDGHQQTLFSMGCNQMDTMEFSLSCQDTRRTHIAEYTCLGSWEEDDGNTFIVASSVSSSSSLKKYCLSYRQARSSILPPLESHLRMKKVEPFFTNEEYEEVDSVSGLTLRFLVTGESCRRDASQGIGGYLEFNASRTGICNDQTSSTSTSVYQSTIGWGLIIIMVALCTIV